MSIQDEIRAWNAQQFPTGDATDKLLGIMEEVGELTRAHLKEKQGIRLNEDHVANAKDAVGDIAIFLYGYCALRGWDMEQIISDVWCEVSQRDYRNPSAFCTATDDEKANGGPE